MTTQSTDELVKRLAETKGHTLGPWAISRDDREGMEWNLHIVSAPDPNLTICFMAHDGDGKNEHGEANAHLIALAPKMKDTIERLQRELAARDKTIETLREQRDSWHKQYCLASEREADCVAKMALMREQYQREIARMAQHGIAKADAARSEGEQK